MRQNNFPPPSRNGSNDGADSAVNRLWRRLRDFDLPSRLLILAAGIGAAAAFVWSMLRIAKGFAAL